MRYVLSADEMRRFDAITIEDIGLPGAVLMENAGRAVVDVVVERLAEAGELAGHVAVVCGAGNNGGDGHVIARCLRQRGIDAAIYLAAPADRLGGDARLHFEAGQRVPDPPPVHDVADAGSLAAAAAAIEGAAAVVDAVFGTGLARPVEGHYRAVIEAINRCRGRVIAVDIPSGLSADTGEVLGVCVEAHDTVTMAFLKIGLAISPGFVHAGRVHVAEIGIPEALGERHGVAIGLLEAADVAPLIPALSPIDHKNRRGHLLAVAGSPGKRGAARLLGWAALRCGAGLVTVAAPGGPSGEFSAPDPIMTAILDPDGPTASAESLATLSRGKHAVAMGPGMPVTSGGRALVRAALAELDIPLLLDADGLNHLGGDLERVAEARAAVVMTPHPGEAARLLGSCSAEVQRNRIDAVRRIARGSRAVVVLKGARTLICDGRAGGDRVTINPTGSPALATAGTGDVLTGIISALLAQGLDAADAARLGAYLHGKAGELAAEALGPRSVTAADLSDHLPSLLRTFD